jgi:hypothetical protein
MATANLGRVGFVNKGNYVGGVTLHKINNVVRFNDAIYACIQEHSIEHLPTDTAYWELWVNNPNTVGTIAALRLTTYSGQQIVSVTGYYTAADNIGVREYFWDALSAEADNGGTTIQVTGVVTGRWKMKVSGAVNVKWFGAKGDWDGTTGTDDSSSIQNAVNAHDDVLIPKGQFACRNITLNRSGITIKGEGSYSTFLVNNGSTTNDDIIKSYNTDYIYHCIISDIGFRFKRNTTLGYAIRLTKCLHLKLENFFIEAFTPDNILISETGAIYLDTDCYFNNFKSGYIYMNRKWLKIRGEVNHAVNDNIFESIATQVRYGTYATIEWASNNIFNHVDMEALITNTEFSWSFVELISASYNEFNGCYFDQKGYGFSLIKITGTLDLSSNGNVITLCNMNHTNNYGVYLDTYCRFNKIENNYFANNNWDIFQNAAGTNTSYNIIGQNVFADSLTKILSQSCIFDNTLDASSGYLKLSKTQIAGIDLTSTMFLNSQTIFSGTTASSGSKFLFGTGSPEGVVFGNVGSIFLRTDGGKGTSLYIKESGSGIQLGWVRLGTATKNTTANRPTLTANEIGTLYLDTTLAANGKPIWWNGALWVDANGTSV